MSTSAEIYNPTNDAVNPCPSPSTSFSPSVSADDTGKSLDLCACVVLQHGMHPMYGFIAWCPARVHAAIDDVHGFFPQQWVGDQKATVPRLRASIIHFIACKISGYLASTFMSCHEFKGIVSLVDLLWIKTLRSSGDDTTLLGNHLTSILSNSAGTRGDLLHRLIPYRQLRMYSQ